MSGFQTATTEPVSRVQIARYAGAVGDFNPVHVDEEFAKAAGLPSSIAHGPLTLSLVIDALAAHYGPDRLRRLDARLKAPVFPHDVLQVVPIGGGELEVRNASGAVVATATYQAD